MRAAPIPFRPGRQPLGQSKRMLRLAGDDRLVEQIRRGSEAAFEVAFERHGQAILSYCRHMLRSREEAEDVVQHTFAAAYGGMLRDDRPIKLKPWLFTIARNRCLSVLRGHTTASLEHHEPPSAALSEQVERRAELRELLDDLGDLPEEQRAALLLAELGDLSHTDVASVLGCEVHRVKALVFRARSGLIERREARDTSCERIREQLAVLRGGALRRSELRHHLRHCAGCRAYRDQVRHQRKLLAAALPVTPSLGLKSAVLGSVGMGGGASAAGGGGLGGGLVAAAAQAGGATVTKVAVVGALIGGGAVAGEQALENSQPGRSPAPAAAPDARSQPAPVAGRDGTAGARRGAPADRGNGKALGRTRRAAKAPAGAKARRRGHSKRAGRDGSAKRGAAPGAGGTGPRGNAYGRLRQGSKPKPARTEPPASRGRGAQGTPPVASPGPPLRAPRAPSRARTLPQRGKKPAKQKLALE